MTDPTAPTRPRRRWYQFSLLSLLVVITIAALVTSYTVRPRFRVIGDLDRTDIAAICSLIETSEQVSEKRILEILFKVPGEVQVTTGEVRNGHVEGILVNLDKKNGVWTMGMQGFIDMN